MSIVHTTCISGNFDIRDLRPGQFRNLPMLIQCAKFSTTSFPHRNISIHSEWNHLWSSVTIHVSVFIDDPPKRSSEVTQSPTIFTNNFCFRKGGYMGVVSLCFSRIDASTHMQYDILGSPRNLDLRSNCDPDPSRSAGICVDAYGREKHDGTKINSLSLKTKKIQAKNCLLKCVHFQIPSLYVGQRLVLNLKIK